MARRAVLAKGAGLAVALLLCVRSAVSQEPAGNDGARHGASQADASASQQREAVNALQREVKGLQDELARLREQLAKVDHQLDRLQNMQGCGAPPAGAEASKGGSGTTSRCTPPYYVADGIKRFLPECLDSPSPSCDPPFTVDPDGIRRYRKDCLDTASESAGDHCDPPFYLLDDGTKQFKVDCL
jgi:hypothetical protein